MRILVNAVAAKMGGALRHVRGLLSGLSGTGQEHEFRVCVDKTIDLAMARPNIRFFRVSLGGSLLRSFYWHEVEVPGLARKLGMDLVLSLLNFGPSRPPVGQISVQANSAYFCKYYLNSVGARARVEAILRRWVIYRTMRASGVIVTPTAAMRDMIRSTYPDFRETRFRVIPHGFEVREFLEDRDPLSERAARLLERTRDEQIRLLYATHPAPYKGVEILLHALRSVRDSGVDARLFLTMELADWPRGIRRILRVREELGLEDDVVLLGRIPQRAIATVYESCDVFVFPSLCESFGFPMLEAMSAGLPIVAGDTPVNREILGKAALYYPPLDHVAAAHEILRVARDRELGKGLSEASLERLAERDWGWKRYARELMSLVG